MRTMRTTSIVDQVFATFGDHLAGYIAKHYGSWSTSAHVDADDMIQEAYIETMGIVERWDEIAARSGATGGPLDNLGLLWIIMKREAHDASYVAAGFKLRRPPVDSINELAERAAETGDSRIFTVMRVEDNYSILINDVVDHFVTLPTRLKAMAALRFFLTLPLAEICRLMELSITPVQRWLRTLRTHMAAFARNQVNDFVQDVPTILPSSWDPPATLTKYLSDTHGWSVHDLIGLFVLAMRADGVYLVNMVSEVRFEAPGQRVNISESQQAAIDEMYANGVGKAAIARALGIGEKVVYTQVARAV